MTAARDSSEQATGPSGRSPHKHMHMPFTLQTQSRLRPGVVSHDTDTHRHKYNYYGEQMLAVTEGSVDPLT